MMYEAYRKRLKLLGGNIRLANRHQSQAIMAHGFANSQSYRRVYINGDPYDAHIVSDSKTTVRGGSGNYVIQFKKDFPIEAGTYIDIPDSHGDLIKWLLLYESDATLFPKHIIKKCNYLLKWKNSKGNIVERWAVFSDNLRLTDGERAQDYNKLVLPYYGTSLILPCDEETINIKLDQRFIIDHSDVEGNPEAWMVTNRNVISKRFDAYDGVIELYVILHQFNHKTDSKEFMIADYYSEPDLVEDVDTTTPVSCRI